MPIQVPAGSFYRLNCALVLEDEPVGQESRLEFETFPESIEEVYAVTSYRKIGADRMPQPGGVAYRGGDWSTFSIELQFRAGHRASGRADRPPVEYSRTLLEQELVEMSRKARWCQALCFPLRRQISGSTQERILRTTSPGGRNAVLAAGVRQALNELQRNDPPKVLVVFGAWMTVRGYATNVTLKWMPPYDPVTNRPYGCTVNIQIQPLMVNYPTWQSISGGAWSQQARGNDPNTIPSGAASIQAEEEQRRQDRLAAQLGEASP